MIQLRFRKLPAVWLPVSLVMLALVGACRTGRNGERPRTLTEADAQLAERPVAMRGVETYFDGRVQAIVTVSRGLGTTRSGRRGIFEGGERRNADGTPDLSEVFKSELNDLEKNDLNDIVAKMQALQVTGSPLPPVLIRVQLTNNSADAITVGIDELNSYLGNFAVRPENLVVSPGQNAEPEAMSSRLGVTSDEIPVKLTLTVDGKSETHTLAVKSLISAANGASTGK